MLQVQQALGMVKNTHDHRLTMLYRQGGQANIQRFSLDPDAETAILRKAFFRDVKS